MAPSPSDAGVAPEQLQEIVRRTGEAMASCMQALNLGGIKLQALMDAVETRYTPFGLPVAVPCKGVARPGCLLLNRSACTDVAHAGIVNFGLAGFLYKSCTTMLQAVLCI